MKYESVRELKSDLSAKAAEAMGDDPGVVSYLGSSEPPMPEGVALGVARQDGEFLLAVRTDDPAKAEAMRQAANGEADVRILTVAKRSTPGYFQGTHRPLEPGLQIGMANKTFLGTLGCIVRDARALYALTNSHVAADEGTASAGHPIGQPFGRPESLIGQLDRFVPFNRTAPNLADAALVRLDRGIKAILGQTAALPLKDLTVRPVTPDDLGRPVRKAGRTTGVRRGTITAVEMDGVRVAYDLGILTYNDQLEVSGGPTTDFSAGGDSGSLIVTEDGFAIGLLFAGGRDGTGEDMTYANHLSVVLGLLGVTLA